MTLLIWDKNSACSTDIHSDSWEVQKRDFIWSGSKLLGWKHSKYEFL